MPQVVGLAAIQNPDGGWGYRNGSSCTEPTVYALLALAASGDANSPAAASAGAWLTRNQRSDGGWAPRPGVDQSTWVTALALLAPCGLPHAQRERALGWLADRAGRESSWVQRARSFLLGLPSNAAVGNGWPWFPDTAAWVTPTCFGLLALEKANRMTPSRHLEERCKSAREYLLERRCRDGGWNHGSTRALGYDSDSYPETTGQALLALHNVPGEALRASLERARGHVKTCRSLEALEWLKLGLAAHGQRFPDRPAPKGHGGVPEMAVNVLAGAAANGRNLFLE